METAAQSDASIIEQSLTDSRLFEVIFDRHFEAVHRFAVGRVGLQDAGDVVAETFARAFDRRQRFRMGKPSALPWLFGIAVNVARERTRKSDRGHRATSRIAVRVDVIAESFESALADRIDAERLRPDLISALRTLSDDEYALLMLVTESDLTYDQMADTLGIPAGTVRSRLSRARHRLRDSLRAPTQSDQQVHVAGD